jgi:hypothetical protein
MRLDELNDDEPFVVKMLRGLLKKEEPLLVVVQRDGTESVLGRIKSMSAEALQPGGAEDTTTPMAYRMWVHTNSMQEYTYGSRTLRRSDIRQKIHPNKWGKPTTALYIPASGNKEDLGGHDL